MTMPDIRQLDARAVRASVSVVSRVTTQDLDRATPCAQWRLAELLIHMTTQHLGFAAAAEGRGADPAVWRARHLGDDLVAAYTASAVEVLTAFAVEGVAQREFAIPEISTQQTFPASRAIGFHFVDTIVHSWDVARSIDVPIQLPADLVRAALPLASAVPDGERRREPGAAFQPGLSAAGQFDPLDRVVALLGRSPAWPR